MLLLSKILPPPPPLAPLSTEAHRPLAVQNVVRQFDFSPEVATCIIYQKAEAWKGRLG